MPIVASNVIDDVSFLQEWERGGTYDLSALLRVRQIHRANPPLARPPAAAAGSPPAPRAEDVLA